MVRAGSIACLAVATAIAFAACGDSEPVSEGDLQRVADGLAKDVFLGPALVGGEERFHVPGTSLTVNDSEGESETVVSGVADLDADEPIEIGQVQAIGSNSKTVTAVLVMQLVEDGTIDLDQRLAEIAEENPGDGGSLGRLVGEYRDNVHDVTLRQLLNHTSGLASWDSTKEWQREFARDPLQDWRLDQLSRFGLENPPLFKPGAEGEWNYSNTDYTLLGMVLEAVRGKPVEEQMAALFEEAGMESSYYAPSPAEVRESPLSERLIHGYAPIPSSQKEQIPFLAQAFAGAPRSEANPRHPWTVRVVSSDPKEEGPSVGVAPASSSRAAAAEGEGPLEYKDVTNAFAIGMGLTAGGIVSNTEDMARFWRALVDGELVSRETFRIMRTTVPLGEAQPQGIDNRWGFGFGYQRVAPGVLFEGSPRYKIWYHLGNVFGYSSAAYWVEEEDLVVANTVDIFPQPVGDLGMLREVLRAVNENG